MKNFKKDIRTWLKNNKNNIILSIIGAIFLYGAYEYYSQYFGVLKNPEEIKRIIMSYGHNSIIAFIALQVIQVVFFFIPGEIIQIAGGYIFDAFYGSLFSIIGITIGGGIVFSISRFFGKPFVEKIISNKHIKFFSKVLNSDKINYIVFILYLIPGIPKDVLAYICGISNVKFKDFLIYSSLGRLPGIVISTYFGQNISSKNIPVLVGVSIVTVILIIIGVVKGRSIINNLNKECEKNKKKF
ncbi:TVP38/TMEM64 family protein [Clostridium tetani]|uniref:TVP38/TMEM64 family membrane protein n=2 Tax=Clostridium tetani TaxID=1513 RepID=Q891G2_CLOTE|nr:TVP38/TMEM64 family protein [Clostridium tetani]AAO36883.1 putative membrane-associated alkaline phosphatase [Clostridium tetani E88]KGI36561.1 membrane protein [Clostridium tetani ATCC 9441]KGI41274.1 membrane protein [Clostridium tetani]KGI41418.1 membrane protein [Clostridium tetani]KGI45744.1 membrane protein [Clostridium tetani]